MEVVKSIKWQIGNQYYFGLQILFALGITFATNGPGRKKKKKAFSSPFVFLIV